MTVTDGPVVAGALTRRFAVLRSAVRANGRLIGAAAAVYLSGAVLGLGVGSTLDYARLARASGGTAVAGAGAGASFADLLAINLAVAVALLAGTVTFGTVPLVLLFSNGVFHFYFVGLVPAGPLEVAALLVPHGLFELPALWIAGAAGFRLPVNFLSYLRERRDTVVDRSELRELGVLAALALSLIVVGAVVEATVTTWLAGHVL
ncbi:stage II sporulation protein M [Halosimplex halophilum]|uniref:stage II sporulation protein M n=1 Tax=Halosimplex halophilum TaxID=2559572 RepID=UPI00107EE99E|nr:stage II sporulation protein M [Halosimplex halophilum]